MSLLTPVQRAESLLSEVVISLFAGFQGNDFPEHFISSLAPNKMEMRLHELQTLEDPTYRLHRAKPLPLSGESQGSGDNSPLQSLESERYRRLLETADQKIAEAVDALWEEGAGFSESYVKRSAPNHMAACLRWLRAQQSPSERVALVAEVCRLRKTAGLGPLDWEDIVTVRR